MGTTFQDAVKKFPATIEVNGLTFHRESYNNTSYRHTVNKPFGIKDDELYMLYGLFIHFENDGKIAFGGGKFSNFRPMNKEMIDDRREDAEDEYDYIWRGAVQAKQTTLSLADWCEQLEDEFFYDNSYRYEDWYDDIVKRIQVLASRERGSDTEISALEPWREVEFMDCSGGGRLYRNGMETADYWDFTFDDIDTITKETLRQLEAKELTYSITL